MGVSRKLRTSDAPPRTASVTQDVRNLAGLSFAMIRSAVTAATVVLALIAFPSGLASHASDPFGFLSPDIAVGLDERQRLERGETVVKVLPGRDGYLALSAIVKVEATTARVVAWTSQVEKLQKGKDVPEVGRFSTPPHLRDLDELTIEPGICRAAPLPARRLRRQAQRRRNRALAIRRRHRDRSGLSTDPD